MLTASPGPLLALGNEREHPFAIKRRQLVEDLADPLGGLDGGEDFGDRGCVGIGIVGLGRAWHGFSFAFCLLLATSC